MNSKIISIIIAFLVFIAGWLSSAGISVKEIKIPFIDTNKGRLILFVGISIIIILLGILQSDLVAEESKQALSDHDKIQQERFDRSISKLMLQTDKNYKQTMLVISDTLGKYGFQYDISQKRVEKLILDSSKTTIINGTDPVVIIQSIEYSKGNSDIYNLWIKIVFKEAPSTNHNLSIYTTAIDSVTGVWEYLGKTSEAKFKNFMINGEWARFTVEVVGYNASRVGEFLIYLKGSYSNSDNTKKFNLNEYYSFNVNTKALAIPAEADRIKFIRYLNAYDNFNLPIE